MTIKQLKDRLPRCIMYTYYAPVGDSGEKFVKLPSGVLFDENKEEVLGYDVDDYDQFSVIGIVIAKKYLTSFTKLEILFEDMDRQTVNIAPRLTLPSEYLYDWYPAHINWQTGNEWEDKNV